MNLIEAGKICRDAGFNWGRGSWWVGCDPIDILMDSRIEQRSFVQFGDPITAHGEIWIAPIPDLSKDATRGVILEWAREKSGDPGISVYLTGEGWDVISNRIYEHSANDFGYWDFNTETEIECYARLCQWVRGNSK